MPPSITSPSASSTDHDEKALTPLNPNGGKGRLWTPFFLRRSFLLSLISIHLALIVVLAILFWYSQSHQGLSTASQRNYLLWTYGPTAACWGQVEYRSKQLAPWKTMYQQMEPAERSLLLDFVSPVNLVSLIHSLGIPGTRHVAVAVGGAVILKIITILSTGLFVFQSTFVEHPYQDIIASTSFGGPNASSFDLSAVDSRVLSRVYGINKYNLPYPPGTTSEYAYQSFNATTLPESSANLTAHVSVFKADLECEVLSVQNVSSYLDSGTIMVNVTLSSNSCPFVKYSTPLNLGHFELYGDIESKKCNDDVGRFYMMTGSTQVNTTQDSVPLDLFKSANIGCKPSYGVFPGTVVISTNSSVSLPPSITTKPGAKASTFPGATAMDIITSMFYSYRPSPTWYVYDGPGTMYLADYLVSFLPNTSKEAVTSDGNLFAKASEAFYKSFAVQIAEVYFTEQTNQSVTGSLTSMEGRLLIRPLAFGLIEGFMLLMVIFAALLISIGAQKTVSCDPGPIGNLASILAASSNLNHALDGTGSCSVPMLRERLSGTGFHSVTLLDGNHEKFSITQEDGAPRSGEDRGKYSGVPSEEEAKKPGNIAWYRPFAITLAARITNLGIPIAVIIALETLYQISRRQNGIADIPPGQYIHYSYAYIPTTVLVGIGLLFASLDFSVKIFQPYATLSQGPVVSQPSLHDDYLGKMGLHCLWDAVKNRQTAVASSSMGMVLTPLLTIAVSGLFFVTAAQQYYDIQLSPTTYFPSSGYNESGETAMDDGYSMASLLLVDNSSEPLFTHDTLAFPQLSLVSSIGEDFGNGLDRGRISVRVPASRAQTNCTILQQERVQTKMSLSKRQLLSGPPGVSEPSSSNTSQSSNITDPRTAIDIDVYGTADKRCSWSLSGIVGNNTYYGSWSKASVFRNGSDYADCPTTYAVFAQIRDSSISNITAMACTPYLESVQTDVTFNAGDFSFDPAAPPMPDETTVDIVGPISLGALGYELNVPDGLTSNQDLDDFFVTLLYGIDGVPPAELVGPANAEHLRDTVNRLYGRILAQILNAHRADATATGPALPARLMVPHRLRLMQNPISTRILEGLLAGVAICAALTGVTLNAGRILPKNPCSVGAVVSLLAGARMLGRDVIPEGAEWLSGGEKRAAGFYDARTYRMGWWPGGRFGIDAEDAAVEQSEGEAQDV
ncbi:hypothetical protein MPH_09160 [Macrophomina phaseolina MS6]|uniref:Uncharacterized protein n=1 Tax=Macrophomina phaseolina (strain MS6) TaxID=1126212 RepID=K2RU34_MACPH|nr:hypothetical protein MPH_09160 [Macrophomina phaseolina MS6]